MKLKPGTVMLAVPKTGADPRDCFVCTGPASEPGHEREAARGAFLVGVYVGVKAARDGRDEALRLCVEHETYLRELLVRMAPDAALCERLGIECEEVPK
jgi:hypothetical protein